MKMLFAVAVVAGLGLACQAESPTSQSVAPVVDPGAGGSLSVDAVVLGPSNGTDTVNLEPLAGALVRIYEKEVTVVTCDSVATSPPTCREETHTVPGAVDVAVPGGGTLRGALAASDTTNSAGRYTAAGLVPGIYFVIVDGPAGGPYASGLEQHVPVADGQTSSTSVFLPRR